MFLYDGHYCLVFELLQPQPLYKYFLDPKAPQVSLTDPQVGLSDTKEGLRAPQVDLRAPCLIVTLQVIVSLTTYLQ